MSRLVPLLVSRSTNVAFEQLSPAELLHDLRALRRRHAAIGQLIAALEEARAAGCDLAGVWCEACPLERPDRMQAKRPQAA